jgi:hypothetical protein
MGAKSPVAWRSGLFGITLSSVAFPGKVRSLTRCRGFGMRARRLDLSRLRGMQRGAQKHLDCCGHGGEAGVLRQALVVAEINLLDDYG